MVTKIIDLAAETVDQIAETTAIIEKDRLDETKDHMTEIDKEVLLDMEMRAKIIQEALVETENNIQAVCAVSDVMVTTFQ